MDDLKIGDKVWYVAGMRGSALFIVHCTIDEIDDEFRKKFPDAFFYWIDEPVGHGLDRDELYLTKEEAIEELFGRAEAVIEYEPEKLVMDANLYCSRQESIKFIMDTWPPGERKWTVEYLDKKQGVDWFNLNDLGFTPTP